MAEAMLHTGGVKHRRGSGLGSFDMSITNSNHNPMKRGRSGSISGRLRTASDLEDMGLIDKAQKGLIKDLIISGDPALRTALDKYETGDAQALEGLIKGGALVRRQSVDLLNGLDLDFLTVQPNNGDSASSFDPSSFPYEDDFFMFPETDFHSGSGNGHSHGDGDSRSTVRRTSSLLGTFDLNGLADGGTFGSVFNMPRRHSLSLPGVGEVDMSAYENMAASLQQKKCGRQPKQPKLQKQPKPPKQTSGRIPKGGRAAKNSDSDAYDHAMGGMGGSMPQQTQYPVQKQTTVHRGMKADGGRGVPAPTYLPGGMISSLYNTDGTVREVENIPGRGEVGYIGAYTAAERRERIARFLAKRDRRVWTKKVKYDVRKNFADSRVRVKGRFVKKEDEELMKELLSIEP